jgi:hypothetical protein
VREWLSRAGGPVAVAGAFEQVRYGGLRESQDLRVRGARWLQRVWRHWGRRR